jgi:ribonuclease BN (tRNA processing enzyme)
MSSKEPCIRPPWFLTTAGVCVLMSVASLADQEQPTKQASSATQVVLLGTGSPPADPDRSGPATAIVVNGTPYLIDFGAGVVRRAKAAVADRGIAALEPTNLRVVFLTHMHSDHTVGYPDLILTPWVLGRQVPLEVYGPAGLKDMTTHILEAYRVDFESRSKQYAPDRSIVISGDTNPTQATIDACNGCDILLHEVLTHDWLSRRPDFANYAARYHTTTTQLAELATKAKPRLLVLYHASIALRPVVDNQRSRPEVLLNEITAHYSGQVVVGRDLDVY